MTMKNKEPHLIFSEKNVFNTYIFLTLEDYKENNYFRESRLVYDSVIDGVQFYKNDFVMFPRDIDGALMKMPDGSEVIRLSNKVVICAGR